jgi:hypothetical protein
MNTQASDHERRTLAGVRNYLGDWAEMCDWQSATLRTLGYLDALIREDIDTPTVAEDAAGQGSGFSLVSEPSAQDAIVADPRGLVWHHLGHEWVAWSPYDKDHVHQRWDQLHRPLRLVFGGIAE